jgi:pyruvate dehydrogenase E1 component alpha subunit
MKLSHGVLEEMYRRMLRIRYFEEQVAELAKRGEIVGGVHCSIGEEATEVGACMALAARDYVIGTHRAHGQVIAKGSDLKPLMAELMGKRTGVLGGKGGSKHVADPRVGALYASAIVGRGISVAVGAALSAKTRGTGEVALSFFGDGASNQGTFHESLNLAAIWKLPVIFLCENNQYAVTTPARYSVSVENIAQRATSYNIPGEVVDGQDVVAVYDVVSAAVRRARQGEGPTLIEAKTYRYKEHAEHLPVTVAYRSPEEIAEWRARDPIDNFRKTLTAMAVLNEEEACRLEAGVKAEVEDATEFARSSPFPEFPEAFEDLYAQPIPLVR